MNTLIIHADISGSPNWRKLGEPEPRLTRVITVEIVDGAPGAPEVAILQPPDRQEFMPDAIVRTGITPELAVRYGRARDVVMREVHARLSRAHDVAGYAADFHERWLRREMALWGMPYPTDTGLVCLMKRCTTLVKIPDARGKGYKWPTLAQAARHFTGQPMHIDLLDPTADGVRIGLALTAIHAGIMQHARAPFEKMETAS